MDRGEVAVVRFAGWAAVLTAGVTFAGVALGGGESRFEVVMGAGIGWGWQVALFWTFAVWVAPGRPLVVYLLGMLGRLLVLAATAVVFIPAADLAPMPMLFSLVAVLAGTTLLEPLFLLRGGERRAGHKPAVGRQSAPDEHESLIGR